MGLTSMSLFILHDSSDTSDESDGSARKLRTGDKSDKRVRLLPTGTASDVILGRSPSLTAGRARARKCAPPATDYVLTICG